jgi:hypothetical protein
MDPLHCPAVCRSTIWVNGVLFAPTLGSESNRGVVKNKIKIQPDAASVIFIHNHNSLPFHLFSLPRSTKIFSWTVTDYETTCRQMGYTGGRYVQWMDRVNSSSSRPLLLENPQCYPGGSSLFECDWNSRRVGAGVCGKSFVDDSTCYYVLSLCFPSSSSSIRQATELFQSLLSPSVPC